MFISKRRKYIPAELLLHSTKISIRLQTFEALKLEQLRNQFEPTN